VQARARMLPGAQKGPTPIAPQSPWRRGQMEGTEP